MSVITDESIVWPTERQGRIRLDHIDDRFADWRDELGLDPVLHPHCLRHAYVTHLIEDGFDPFFVQQQVGHRWGSTTALYTNPWELHQTSEKLQVAWPGWLGSVAPRTRRACV